MGGAKIFKTKCSACHTLNEGGNSKQGPNLHGIFGAKAGSVKTYDYSGAFKNADITWDEDAIPVAQGPEEVRQGHEDDLRGHQKGQRARGAHRLPQVGDGVNARPPRVLSYLHRPCLA